MGPFHIIIIIIIILWGCPFYNKNSFSLENGPPVEHTESVARLTSHEIIASR